MESWPHNFPAPEPTRYIGIDTENWAKKKKKNSKRNMLQMKECNNTPEEEWREVEIGN